MNTIERHKTLTLAEISDELNLPQHVLRFWESCFPQIQSLTLPRKKRYSFRDLILFYGLRCLLYVKGNTIRQVHLLLEEKGLADIARLGMQVYQETHPSVSDQDTAKNFDACQKELFSEKNLHKNPDEIFMHENCDRIVYSEGVCDGNPEEARENSRPGKASGKDREGGKILHPVPLSPLQQSSLEDALFELLKCQSLLNQSLGKE